LDRPPSPTRALAESLRRGLPGSQWPRIVANTISSLPLDDVVLATHFSNGSEPTCRCSGATRPARLSGTSRSRRPESAVHASRGVRQRWRGSRRSTCFTFGPPGRSARHVGESGPIALGSSLCSVATGCRGRVRSSAPRRLERLAPADVASVDGVALPVPTPDGVWLEMLLAPGQPGERLWVQQRLRSGKPRPEPPSGISLRPAQAGCGPSTPRPGRSPLAVRGPVP
jgi:hypothetical protein